MGASRTPAFCGTRRLAQRLKLAGLSRASGTRTMTMLRSIRSGRLAAVCALAVAWPPSLAAHLSRPVAPPVPQASAANTAVEPEWPREYGVADGYALMYAPQIASWERQTHMTAWAAVAFHASTLPADRAQTLVRNLKQAMPERATVIALDRVLAAVSTRAPSAPRTFPASRRIRRRSSRARSASDRPAVADRPTSSTATRGQLDRDANARSVANQRTQSLGTYRSAPSRSTAGSFRAGGRRGR